MEPSTSTRALDDPEPTTWHTLDDPEPEPTTWTTEPTGADDHSTTSTSRSRPRHRVLLYSFISFVHGVLGGQVNNSTKQPTVDVSDWDSVVEAQLATANYVRAGLALVVAVIAASAAISLGNQAEFEKILGCKIALDASYCDLPGGGAYFLIGGVLTLICGTCATVFSSKANKHRKRAGG